MTVSVVSGQTREDTFPIGTIMCWHSTTPPDGWLVCNGAYQQISTYRTLYETITNNGTVFPFGANVGSTFALPNLVNFFTVSPSTTALPAGKNSNVGLSTALGNHTHNMNFNYSIGASGFANQNHYHLYTSTTGSATGTAHSFSTNINLSAGNVRSGANGAQGTAFATHGHQTNGANQTAANASHNHNFSNNIPAVQSASHQHNFNVSAGSSSGSFAFTSSPLVATRLVVFIVLAVVSRVVEQQ